MVQADVIDSKFELGFLEDLENVSAMVAETSEASKDQQSESATGENNTCTCTCTGRICNLISTEKAMTFQRENCLAML